MPKRPETNRNLKESTSRKLIDRLFERDDLSKLNLPASAKNYARMTSKSLGKDNWGKKKIGAYNKMVSDLTNQTGTVGFPVKDIGQVQKI